MTIDLNTQIARVMLEFRKEFRGNLHFFSSAYVDEIEQFFARQIRDTVKLTYDSIRPDIKTEQSKMWDNGTQLFGDYNEKEAFNSCLSQLDNNWKEWKGENK